MWQTILTIVILTVAASYASWRVYRVLRADNGPCYDCQLKKNCKKFGQSK